MAVIDDFDSVSKDAVGIQYSYGLHFLNFGAKYLF